MGQKKIQIQNRNTLKNSHKYDSYNREGQRSGVRQAPDYITLQPSTYQEQLCVIISNKYEVKYSQEY